MDITKRVPIDFFKLDNGRKPLEDWLYELKEVDQNRIFIELKKVALGFRLRRGNFRKITGYQGLWGNSMQSKPKTNRKTVVLHKQ